jgi:hypothetical protein
MAESFDPRHLFLVNRLQGRGITFNLEESLTQSYRPLREALTAFLTAGELGALTYVARPNEGHKEAEGFLQMRERRTRPEADLLFMAPSLQNRVASDLWLRLLTHAVGQAGRRGIERLFACLPAGGEEIPLFHRVGFTIFTRQDLFRLRGQQEMKVGAVPKATIRPYRAEDVVAVRQLYAAVASKQAQQAENAPGQGCINAQNFGPPTNHRRSFVLEKRGEMAGCLTVKLGRIGHWLYVLLHPQAYDLADSLLARGLATAYDLSSGPVYCGVRDYQGGLRVVLEEMGFQHLISRALVVKHTTVRVTDAVKALRPALEKRAEVTTPTVSPANGHQASSHPEPLN